MRKTMTFVIAALLAVMTFMLSTPASAIDKAGALKLCGQNRNCGVSDGGGGYVDLSILQSDGHSDTVSCPPKGQCECMSCQPPKRMGGTTGKPSVIGALRGQPALSVNTPAPKPIPGPGLLETGSGFNSNAPSGTGSPAGGGAPSAPKGPVFR